MSDQDLYAALVPDYRDGRPTLATANGRMITGTADEIRVTLGERATPVRVSHVSGPFISVRDWWVQSCEDPAAATERARRLETLLAELQAHPLRVVEEAEIESISVEKLNLVEHARRELALRGETDQAFVESIIAAVRGFSSYPGHSGGSMSIAVDYVHDLLRWRALSPLTRDPAEWIDRTEISGRPLWQNNRDPRAMSEDGGLTYWLVDESPQDSDSTDAPRYTSAEPFAVPR